MKNLCLLLSSFFWASILLGAQPADNQIKGALIDIEKYEKQFSGQTQPNPSSVKRTLKLLTLTRQRLDSSPSQSHASWIETNQRFLNLTKHLNQFLNTGSSTATVGAAAAVPQSQAGTQTRPTPSAPAQMISQYRVRINKILRDINSVFDTMDKGGIKPFQDPEYVAKFEQSASRHSQSIAKYDAYRNDSDVVAASQALQKLQNMIAFGKENAAKELAELGDVQARLRSINQEIRKLKEPHTPEHPYSAGALTNWVRQLAKVRKAAADTYKPLPEIKQRAYLPNNVGTVEQGSRYDLNDVDRLERSIIGLVNSIDASLKQFKDDLPRKNENMQQSLAHYTEYDPSDSFDQTNHFLSEGRADEIRTRLNTDLVNAQELSAFAQLIKDPFANSLSALVNTVQSTIDQYEANYQQALKLIRMPEAASTDSKLISIAKSTLADYDYVGEYKRLVINTEKAHRSEETSTEKFDSVDASLSGDITLTGTKTTYFYEWDQFQVATAERVGNKYFIVYSTLKYYTSGASTTPLNKWIISKRLQGAEIPEANIDK